VSWFSVSGLEVPYKHQSFIAVQVNTSLALRKPLVQNSVAKPERKYRVAGRLCFLNTFLSSNYLTHEYGKDCHIDESCAKRILWTPCISSSAYANFHSRLQIQHLNLIFHMGLGYPGLKSHHLFRKCQL